MANDGRISKKVAKRIKEEQEKLLEVLSETHIAARACRKTGVSPATYYRWLEDSEFARKAAAARKQGKARTCDLAETALVKLISEGNLAAIKFFLPHNHPEYMQPAR